MPDCLKDVSINETI